MNAIGGYFELEVNQGERNFNHTSYYAVNSCRNAMLLLLQTKKYNKVYLPYYTCGVIMDTLIGNKIDIEYFHLDKTLEIIELPKNEDAVIIYTNYFGLKDNYIENLSVRYTNMIIDNAQAFFSKPINNLDTIYSPRKFFGIPDGGFLHTTLDINIKEFEQDLSFDRCSHLLKRIEISPEEGYKDFLTNDTELNDLPIRRMSKLTSLLLSQIDYNAVEKKRKENFNYLHKNLKKINELNIELSLEAVPMVYPLLINNGKDFKKKLISNRIFVANYWPDVLERVSKDSFEAYLVNNLIPLPIDHRYSIKEMIFILKEMKLHG